MSPFSTCILASIMMITHFDHSYHHCCRYYHFHYHDHLQVPLSTLIMAIVNDNDHENENDDSHKDKVDNNVA